MVTHKQIELLDNLQSLLEKQIELTQQGKISKIAAVSEQANSLVEKIAQEEILELAEFKNRQEQLQELYNDLCLAVAAQKAATAEMLSRVRKGKKLLCTYATSLNNKV